MSNYSKLKKLDETSLQKLKEGKGPVDQCLCPLLSSDDRKSIAGSVKKAFKALGIKKAKNNFAGALSNNAARPVSPRQQSGSPGYPSRTEVVKRNKCGKCGCDKEKFVLKHSYANIRITTPDISSICPCPSDCLPDKDKLQSNIKVIVERTDVTTARQQNKKTTE